MRTFAPAVAGAAYMSYRTFVAYNVIGGMLWVWSMSFAGYLLARAIPNIERHIHIVIAIVIVLSIMPAVVEFFRTRSARRAGSSL